MDGYGKRVLVVDDDEQIRLLMGVVFERAGYNVVPVGDGLDALVEVRKRHFDVVVTDYVMPMLNGQQLFDCIRTMYPEMPVILVSGELPDFLAAGRNTPFFACLRKPFDNDVLLELLRSAVASPEAARSESPSQLTAADPASIRGSVSAASGEAVQRARS